MNNNSALENPFNVKTSFFRGSVPGSTFPSLKSIALRHASLLLLSSDKGVKEILDLVQTTEFINPPLTACWPGLKFDVFRRKYPTIIAHRFEIAWTRFKLRLMHIIVHLPIPVTLKNDLRKTVREIYQAVLSFFLSLRRLNLTFSYERIKVYFSCVCWTAQGTVDHESTTALLADNEKLSVMERYTVVSNFCLHDKISRLKNELPDYVTEDINNFRPGLYFGLYLCGRNEDYRPFIGELKNCFQNTDDRMFNARLLDRAVSLRNRVALKFICVNLQISNLTQSISSLILDTLENQKDVPPDILCYLLSKIDDAKIYEDFGVLTGFRLLKTFAKDSIWQNHFKKIAQFVLKYTMQVPATDAFRTIALCWLRNLIDRDRVEKMLNEFKLSYNIPLNIHYLVNFQDLFAVSLHVNDSICFKLLQLQGTEEAQKLLYNDDVMLRLKFGLYIAGKVTLFKSFVRRIFITEDELNKYQSLLLWNEANFIGKVFPKNKKQANQQ